MKQLVSIELHFNELTGTIPDVYLRANALQHLNLGGNFLTGTISTKVGKLNQVKGLFLMDNRYVEGFALDRRRRNPPVAYNTSLFVAFA